MAKQQMRGSKRKRTHEARGYRGKFVILILACIACAILVWPPAETLPLGLDLEGGTAVVLKAESASGGKPSASEMAEATRIVQDRAATLGLDDATVAQDGSDTLAVTVRDGSDPEDIAETLGQTGYLEFVKLDTIGDADALSLIRSGRSNVAIKEGTYQAFMDGSHIQATSIGQTTSGDYVVNIVLDKEGTKLFREATEELAPDRGQIAIVLDGVVATAPAVSQPITNGQLSISGGFSASAASELKSVLDSGSLPVTLSYSESRTVAPLLDGSALVQAALICGVAAALALVLLFVFWHGMTLVALAAELAFVLLYAGCAFGLGRLGALSLSFASLPGACLGAWLTLDACVLVFEGLDREIRKGYPVRAASVTGVQNAAVSFACGAGLVALAAAIFFFAGPVQLRAVSLAALVGTGLAFAVLYLAIMPLVRLVARGAAQARPGFWGIKAALACAPAAASAEPDSEAADGTDDTEQGSSVAGVEVRPSRRRLTFELIAAVVLVAGSVCALWQAGILTVALSGSLVDFSTLDFADLSSVSSMSVAFWIVAGVALVWLLVAGGLKRTIIALVISVAALVGLWGIFSAAGLTGYVNAHACDLAGALCALHYAASGTYMRKKLAREQADAAGSDAGAEEADTATAGR